MSVHIGISDTIGKTKVYGACRESWYLQSLSVPTALSYIAIAVVNVNAFFVIHLHSKLSVDLMSDAKTKNCNCINSLAVLITYKTILPYVYTRLFEHPKCVDHLSRVSECRQRYLS